MEVKQYTRTFSLWMLFVAYVVAISAGYIIFLVCPSTFSPVLSSLIADLGATLVIYLFSLGFNNSSFYDPYWSVIPFVLALYWSVNYGNPASMTDTIILVVILLWSLRLTSNFIRGWNGIDQEDWRYGALKTQSPRLYWLTNLTGIHLFPTLLVFTGMMPVYVFMHRENIPEDYNYVLGGGLLSVAGTTIELIADEQLRRFKKQHGPNESIRSGLWNFTRHPNYFGEILFWWGLWIMMMGINNLFWWTGMGALAITMMFVFISIPMMEKKSLQTKQGYKQYIKDVSMLIPWFSRKS